VLPRSLSASSIKNFLGCPARYVAENFNRGANFQGDAANLGIVLHGALEDFLRGVKIKRNMIWDLDVLLKLYDENFLKIIGPDLRSAQYKDGRQIAVSWFNRSYIFDDIIGAEVLSLEAKNSFEVPVLYRGAKTMIQFNYIMDRFDRIGPGEYRVVDYKSGRLPLTADELYDNLQAKVYAMVAAITHKDATKIWVEFDFLRHEKVGVMFTREDNIATWKMLKTIAQNIIDTDENNPTETLNPECLFCIKKATCKTLARNVNVGGILSLSLDEVGELYHDITAQTKALEQLKGELEMQLLMHAANNDVAEYELETTRVKVSTYSRRYVEPHKLIEILGHDAVVEMGNVSMGAVDELVKSNALTETQKAAIKAITHRKTGSPSVRVTKKK
jgi:hypothetical protein